jgi:glycosyltransferase involved in cell wall biosynthesis
MSAPLLSICIPTYNRLAYLRELLPPLLRETVAVNAAARRVALLVSSNACTDGTDEWLAEIKNPFLDARRHPANIGGDRNFLSCVERARGEYVWLLGDDELLAPGALAAVVKALETVRPKLLILRQEKAEGAAPPPALAVHADYAAYLRDHCGARPCCALAHTLISANVFRRDAFDLSYARKMLPTNYAHMYGLMEGLARGGAVALLGGALRVRSRRAQFEHWPTALCVKQGVYLWRLGRRIGLPELRRDGALLAANLPLEIASRLARRISPRFGRT